MSNKYKNKKVFIHPHWFDSMKEAGRYMVLHRMEKKAEIIRLELQKPYELAPSVVLNGRKKPALKYVADFVYFDNVTGALIVEDVKSDMKRKLPEYRIKKDLMKSVHGIEISEV